MVATSFQDMVKGTNVFVVALTTKSVTATTEDSLVQTGGESSPRIESPGEDVPDGSEVPLEATKDALFGEYLAAFPAGSDPVYKTTTEHDCRCCRHFIRRAGNVVTVDDRGNFRTVWDRAAEEADGPYRVVAARMRDVVRAATVRDLYRVDEKEMGFGAVQTRAMDKETQQVRTWSHFHTGEIPKSLRSATVDQVRGDYRTTVQVFERGLIELHPGAVETVLSLVEAGNLYRGEEHKSAILQFQKTQRAFLSKSAGRARDVFAWANAGNPAARFRNTVIGTLVQDLSEGQDVEHAVQSFETKVAPQNYKRTIAIITPGMVKKAMETIEALGLESALERRFAVISDISVNDVKWVDGTVKPLMKGGIGDVLMQHAGAYRSTEGDEKRAEDIDLDTFVTTVLPETTSLELLFKSAHLGNLMSLTAPCHPEPKRLFRWGNDFAWTYDGNVADSIKERVKKAGGKVDGAILRVSLSWFNFDDLDLHVHEPAGRNVRGLHDHIYFGNKTGWTGGTLDVDMNAGGPRSREAVENVVWAKKPVDGAYRVVVNNYTHRETSDPGFVIEVETDGKLSHYSYNKGVRQNQDIAVVTLHVKNGLVDRFEVGDPAITAANISQEKWGLKTEQYVKVSAVTLSPNYWGSDAVGNKHTFFVIEGARNDAQARGFYNEFLHPRLEEHRKVFEVIGDKTKCPPTNDQLSGLGFSSTMPAFFIVRAWSGKKQRVFNVRVGA
jgi:hypothetical protein